MTLETIPAWMPSGMKRRALLLAGYFKLINRFRRQPVTWLVLAILVVAVGWLVTRPEAASVLAAAADRSSLVFLLALIQGSMSVARRKQRVCAEIENSWVSPLPFQVWAPVRLSFSLVLQVIGVAVVLAAIVATSDATCAQASSIVFALLLGFAGGGALGWFFMPRFKTPVAGSRYAIVRPVRATWATAPRLAPLSYWAAAQARVLNNPRVNANTLVIILLSVPMGTPGEVAIAAAACWMVGLHLLLTLVAMIRTAFAAGWWLAPTPLRTGRFILAMSWRAIGSQVVACAVLAFIGAALLQPRMAPLAMASLATWLLLAIGLVFVACVAGLKPTSAAAARFRWGTR